MRVRAPFSLATLDPRQRACDTTRAVHRAHLECLPYAGSSSAHTTHGDWVDAALSGGLTVSGFVLLYRACAIFALVGRRILAGAEDAGR